MLQVSRVVWVTCVVGVLLVAGSAAAEGELVRLRDHVGDSEEVNVTLYVLGYPPALAQQIGDVVRQRLGATSIVDARPWWIPNIPRHGAEEFALAPAPEWLPPELTPPDGMIRYDPLSFTKVTDPGTGQDAFLPLIELEQVVDDWHDHADVMNYVEHAGSFRDVPWQPGQLRVVRMGESALAGLYARLEAGATSWTGGNPAETYQLYSYNDLFEWLDEQRTIAPPSGGAAMVLLNLARFADHPYAFAADSMRDQVPTASYGPIEVQYPPATASSSEHQAVADLLSGVLAGGLTQAKMGAALDVECIQVATAADLGVSVPGMQPTQPLCALWRHRPVRNLLGPAGRRYFVSDSTVPIAQGGASQPELLEQLADDVYELYRFGVMAPTIKANSVWSAAKELRTAVIDLRLSALELCLLQQLGAGVAPEVALPTCEATQHFYPTEQTYSVEDVFDVDLAVESLSQVSPGAWFVNMLEVPFGLQPDGSVNPIVSAVTKVTLRDALNTPTVVDPNTGEAVQLTHPPLYRTLQTPNLQGQPVELTASWEHGFDFNFTVGALVLDAAQGGLGIYDLLWPDAQVRDEPAYRDSGRPTVHPHALLLTPTPDGPLGERWGTFTINFTSLLSAGWVSTFSGGGFWGSVAGNEGAGGILRRDFANVVPQYWLGPNRANGDEVAYGVLPDGAVFPTSAFEAVTSRAMDAGAPHWCDQWNDPDPVVRQTCRDFVRSTTTLQSIETLQHGLGYMHSEEPRKRYHFDGEVGSIARLYELAADPGDTIGHVLHQMVNMYTTLGASNLWGQCLSDWNGASPHAGLQASLYRSHAREAMAAAEDAIVALQAAAGGTDPLGALGTARSAQSLGLRYYDDWDYAATLAAAMVALSKADAGLTALGQPDVVHDPLDAVGNPLELPGIAEQLDAAQKQALMGLLTR